LFGIWRWSTLRLPAGLVLGTAILAALAASDSPSRERLARAHPPPERNPAHVVATAGVIRAAPVATPAPSSAEAHAAGSPADTPDGGPHRVQPSQPVQAADFTGRPEGSMSTLQPSDAQAYSPTEARLLSPSGRYAPVDADIRIRFNMPVRDRRAFEQAFHLEPAVAGRLDWADSRTLRFRPDRLAYGTAYQVRVATAGLPTDGGKEWRWTIPTVKRSTLTFDDCPTNPGAARDLLAFLRQRHISAVTFPTGQCSRKYPWLVPALLADGHQVCNHTFSHADLPKLTDAQISAEIAGGVHAGCDLLRPPYGDWDGPGGRVERAAAQQGYRLQLWDVDTLDWTGLSAKGIVARIYDGGGGVILMHFQGRHTLEALKLLDVPSLTGQA
jgi:peptidoglycan/xylan/chitin deacetylase (PgdA/CDA1 family)